MAKHAGLLSDLERLPDWETRLSAYLADARPRVQAREQNLCALFAAGAVEAVTGTDPAKPFRRKYAATAKRLEAAMDELTAARPAALARRGDLAWHGGSVGVVVGSEAVFVGETPAGAPDLVRVHRRDWEKAWSVGNG